MKYFIWSHRHSQWWGPDRAGYTVNIAKAGVYNKEDAADITVGGSLPGSDIAIATTLGPRLAELPPKLVEKELEVWRRL